MMTQATYDILGIGNAIVDVVTRTDDAFLSRHDMHKGAMILIDSAAADALYAAMPPGPGEQRRLRRQQLRRGGRPGFAGRLHRQGGGRPARRRFPP
jgi:sugar/nucleoside kinase (ribokinase family)